MFDSSRGAAAQRLADQLASTLRQITRSSNDAEVVEFLGRIS
jgi:hypothetical protein